MVHNLKSLIDFHKKAHPSIRVQDVYKLLYQGAMGPHHLVEDQNAAHLFLQHEFADLELPRDCEELMEPVSIDGSVIRINLRVFRRMTRDEAPLFSCMLASAKKMVPDEKLLRSLWDEFKQMNARDLLNFAHQEIVRLDDQLASKGLKAIRHSEEYRLREKPAYRVVLRKCYKAMSGLP